MLHDTHQTQSLWEKNSPSIKTSNSIQDLETEICIIGAGIAGLSTAYQLVQEGKTVTVLDDGPAGGGETIRTTAHLANVIDDRFSEIHRIHGDAGVTLAIESHAHAIDTIEKIIRDENISCDFVRLCGYLFTDNENDYELLIAERDLARRCGLNSAKLLPKVPAQNLRSGLCVAFSRQAQFHPMKYLHGLAQAIQKKGSKIFTDVHVTLVEKGSDHVLLRTQCGNIVRAQKLIVATNSPINNLVTLHTKIKPFRTYVIGAQIPKGALPLALYWDTEDPYHYIRVVTSADLTQYDLVLIGGEDHKTGQAHDGEERFLRLERWARAHIPVLGTVVQAWSGQVMETLDGLAFIGRDSENIFVATGDSGMGMTHGTIASLILKDLVQGRSHPWEKFYDPARTPIATLGKFAKENFNVAGQYLKWLCLGDRTTLQDLSFDSGAVIRQGITMQAVYKDEHGTFHKFSAMCPHFGGLVEWNEIEKTWDCPCHGSRFSCKGEVLNGPANSNLQSIEEEKPLTLALPVDA